MKDYTIAHPATRTRIEKNNYEDDIPCATDFVMARCTKCPHLHIILLDEKHKPFAEMVIGDDHAMLIGREGAKPSPPGVVDKSKIGS